MAHVFTSLGEAAAVDILDGTASVPGKWWIGWGTSTVAAAKGDTALGAPVGNRATATAYSQASADKLQWVKTLTATKAMSVAEAGLFTSSATGMWISSQFAVIPLATDDQITFTVSLELT